MILTSWSLDTVLGVNLLGVSRASSKESKRMYMIPDIMVGVYLTTVKCMQILKSQAVVMWLIFFCPEPHLFQSILLND